MQRLLSINEVASTLGCSETSISRQVKEGTMVKPVRVGRRITFPSDEVYAILTARIKGASIQSIRQLAKKLVEKRQEA
ncbi:helix-turn-helix transcriptional regulator [Vibrio parahaemolyticus]|uniref:helix-turn-helix transcriptional regulator n=1 Tax=Vibrio parahaemolyticus TaxID=670 RepID=UPI0005F23F00|nr:helix-turn-helix domain-containing protein [Vibrio parahaemolyticus]